MSTAGNDTPLKRTPLHALHLELNARMVPFADYEMPLQYKGILAEHHHARTQAVVFDVSHMGQAMITGDQAEAALESLVVADLSTLASGRIRYTLLTNDRGGIIDDMMIANGGAFYVVIVNAARRDIDYAHLRAHLGTDCQFQELSDRALIALQGPAAATVLARLAPAARIMLFMSWEKLTIGSIKCSVARSGYTGEDGFEISVAADEAEDLMRMLLSEPEVAPAGLGARDTLRLEAGLCLYGNDIDESTTPIEAGLAWTIGKRRRESGGFPGDSIILEQMLQGPPRWRIGLRLEGRIPARAGATICSTESDPIGTITSGGFSPTIDAPIAMGYVATADAVTGRAVAVPVRNRSLAGQIVPLPFVEHRYAR